MPICTLRSNMSLRSKPLRISTVFATLSLMVVSTPSRSFTMSSVSLM